MAAIPGLEPPSGSTVATANFMTNADFEQVKHDPMLVLERATQFVNLLDHQQNALHDENTLLQQQLRQENERVSFTPEQHATLVETASELELDHRELSQKYVDLEHINKMMHGVVDVLTQDKQRLIEEVSGCKKDNADLVSQYAKLQREAGDSETHRDGKEAQLKTQQEETDVKLSQLEEYSKRVSEMTQKTIDLQDAAEKIGSGRLALEAETTALEQSTQQQERTLAYLQSEVHQLDSSIRTKADEMVQLKKQMSASILELQLQITKSEEEMARIRTTVANEKDLTGRQNLWLAKDLQTKTQELLLTRQEMTSENEELKTDLAKLREKSSRLKSNVLVVEKRNQIRHDDLKRLETEDSFAKQGFARRKDNAFAEMNEQAAVLAKLDGELKSTRDELYVVKAKLCKQCRMSILHTAATN